MWIVLTHQIPYQNSLLLLMAWSFNEGSGNSHAFHGLLFVLNCVEGFDRSLLDGTFLN